MRSGRSRTQTGGGPWQGSGAGPGGGVFGTDRDEDHYQQPSVSMASANNGGSGSKSGKSGGDGGGGDFRGELEPEQLRALQKTADLAFSYNQALDAQQSAATAHPGLYADPRFQLAMTIASQTNLGIDELYVMPLDGSTGSAATAQTLSLPDALLTNLPVTTTVNYRQTSENFMTGVPRALDPSADPRRKRVAYQWDPEKQRWTVFTSENRLQVNGDAIALRILYEILPLRYMKPPQGAEEAQRSDLGIDIFITQLGSSNDLLFQQADMGSIGPPAVTLVQLSQIWQATGLTAFQNRAGLLTQGQQQRDDDLSTYREYRPRLWGAVREALHTLRYRGTGSGLERVQMSQILKSEQMQTLFGSLVSIIMLRNENRNPVYGPAWDAAMRLTKGLGPDQRYKANGRGATRYHPKTMRGAKYFDCLEEAILQFMTERVRVQGGRVVVLPSSSSGGMTPTTVSLERREKTIHPTLRSLYHNPTYSAHYYH